MKNTLTAAYVRSRLIYNPLTGIFTWRKVHETDRFTRTWNTKHAGQAAGRVANHGYVQIKIEGRLHYAHRIAWLWVHGRYPEGILDHEDGNPTNNILLNLREASLSENCCNARLQKNNKSGYKGVSWNEQRGKWAATIRHDKRSYFLGYYDDKHEAARVVAAKRVELHGQFARSR